MTIRLALFDIDGTLLRTGNRVHSRSMVEAATEVTGHDISKHFSGLVDTGGRTDRYIVSELLRLCGESNEAIENVFPEIARLAVMKTGAGLAEPVPNWALPGAQQILEHCDAHGVGIGLVTGNLPQIAEIKLRAAGLWDPFAKQDPLISGFGDISENRNDLSAAAFAQAVHVYEGRLEAHEVWIVGDTPRDVECAHAIGARCLGVTTGHFSAAELAKRNCDVIVESLADVDLRLL